MRNFKRLACGNSRTQQFLDLLLAHELSARQERSITVRTKLAHFPTLKSLDSFNFDAQPSLDRRVVNELQSVAFVGRAENVALHRQALVTRILLLLSA